MPLSAPVAIASDAQNNATTNINTITVPAGGVPQNALIIVRCTVRTGGTVTGVADSRGNSYTVRAGGNRAADGGMIPNVAYATAASALLQNDTIVVTYSLSAVRVAIADYVTGNATVSVEDETWNSNPPTGSFGTAVDGGAAGAQITQAHELVVSCVCLAVSSATLIVDSGYTALPSAAAATTRVVLGEYKITTGLETPHPQPTLSAASDWVAVSVAFKDTPVFLPLQGVIEFRGEIITDWAGAAGSRLLLGAGA